MCRSILATPPEACLTHTPYGWPAGTVQPNGQVLDQPTPHTPHEVVPTFQPELPFDDSDKSDSTDDNKPICLDWLRGNCDTKRWRCKFAHPPLELIPKTERRTCPVWALTGHCKFGKNCRRGRHPSSHRKPVCAPVPSDKALYGKKTEPIFPPGRCAADYPFPSKDFTLQ
eukprot:TRINITY_DN12651_c0_g1_i1.p1 TRINITY_DN12651_c0_g1~~TRINITY_DN12651_c0_g1_i1.p1  ORF type:complete len:170 (-),score=7.71 TRINITY_DN12651_c0_g1_i1:271-780(-)